MPPDIRSFFGGKGATLPPNHNHTPTTKDEKSGGANKRRSKSRMIIDDSDDDYPPEPKNSTPKKTTPKRPLKVESPKGEETTTADYFASSAKPKPATAPIKSAKVMKESSNSVNSTPAKSSPTAKKDATKIETNTRKSAQMQAHAKPNYYDDQAAFIDDDDDAGDDIFAADARTLIKRKDDEYVEIESDEDIKPKPKKAAIRSKPLKKGKDEDFEMEDITSNDNMEHSEKILKTNGRSAAGNKRKSVDLGEDESDEFGSPKKGKSRPAKKPRASAKKSDVPESAAIQAIFNSIPTVRAPTPPPKDPEAGGYDWRKHAAGGGNSGPPPASGSKELPTGAENCLVGLTFVFTGLLETISRETGLELVKRYGGKVTTSPSGKTSYVVIGSDAGPSKLEKIRKLNIKTIDEEGLFELIRRLPANGGDGKAAEKSLEKQKADDEKARREAEEMEKEEKRRVAEEEKIAKKVAAARGLSAPANAVRKAPLNDQLWTVKYAPTSLNQICGNKGQVEKIQRWLTGYSRARKFNFQLPGPEGLGIHRAILISGPPGIGKTTAAHLAAKLAGYDVVESNASDTRSRKLVDNGLGDTFDNTSLLGYFAGDGKAVETQKQKVVLIMDEVDGMSAGDRGGVVALAKICKKTEMPLILICNERNSQKMKPLDRGPLDLKFIRPTPDMVRARVATICHREGLKLDKNTMDALIQGSNSDIRQIVNMLSTAKLDQDAMDFSQVQSMSKAWEKLVVLKPWDICHKLLGSGLFSKASKATLNDKIELYFNDHELSFLMVQENYLLCKPINASSQNLSPKEYNLKVLELADQAAESISDGDLVDRMIHGSQQQWSLMPTHAVFSAVRPASFMSGALSGRTEFTKWLGNNSKFGKSLRCVKEIQSHMRLKTSGDRHEIRQQYLPVLWEMLIKRLDREGKDCVEDVINLMDEYYLTRDDFDYIMELGLGPQDIDKLKIDAATKSHFTRLYNSRSHPLPFMKAGAIVAPPKAARVVPDLEEALDDDDEDEAVAEPKVEEDESTDIFKDKYIKKPSKKGKKGGSKKKSTKNEEVDDDDEDEGNESEVVQTKGSSAKSKAAGKGRAATKPKAATKGKSQL